jgi:preprotein translocase SecE subunit
MVRDGIKYLREVYGEFSRVTWPDFSEFFGATVVVLFVVFLSVLYIGALDFVLAKVARLVFTRYAG